jgi:hypothetical protein
MLMMMMMIMVVEQILHEPHLCSPSHYLHLLSSSLNQYRISTAFQFHHLPYDFNAMMKHTMTLSVNAYKLNVLNVCCVSAMIQVFVWHHNKGLAAAM